MKMDRLMGILTVLLQTRQVTAPYLAEKFEVSRRTITRDVDALCRAGIPVVTTQGAHGGISIAEGYKLDKSVLTHDELANIVASLKGLGSVSDASSMGRTLDKLMMRKEDAVVSMRESIIIDLASNHKGALTEKIEKIKEAIREGRVIAFDYYYEKGQVRRRIEPYCVMFYWSSWYVFGYCLKRRDFRMFKLTRLWGLSMEVYPFRPREVPPEKLDFSGYFTDAHQLVAVFAPSARYVLIDTYGLDCYQEQPDGRLRLEVGYTNPEYMLRWLLSFGDEVQVLQPQEMADAIRVCAGKMLERYEKEDV